MDDVVLINPPYPVLEEPLQEHLGLGYIAAYLREHGVRCAIHDATLASLKVAELASIVKESGARLVGLSVPYQDSFPDAVEVVRALRADGFEGSIMTGGIFPSAVSERILADCSEIDFVVRGEGEETVFALWSRLSEEADLATVDGLTYRDGDQIRVNPARPLIDDLDSLPDAARDTLPAALARRGSISVSSSRGCFGRCSFCSIASFYDDQPGRKYRARSAGRVVDEIQRLTQATGTDKVLFVDAEFIGPGIRGRDRAICIAEEILRRGLRIRFRIEARAGSVDPEVFSLLKRAGLEEVFLGIESGVPEVLKRFDKDTGVEQNIEAINVLRDLKVNTGIGFIMFDPFTTMDELTANLEFLRQTGIPMSRLAKTVSPDGKLIVFTGTRAERELRAAGLLDGDYRHNTYKIIDRKARTLQSCLTAAASARRQVYRAQRALGLLKTPDGTFDY
ncbi:MAG: radical SAM protein [Actinomycetota bacterium]|nr:radical SAM protein [Actinomycetota bacterium]